MLGKLGEHDVLVSLVLDEDVARRLDDGVQRPERRDLVPVCARKRVPVSSSRRPVLSHTGTSVASIELNRIAPPREGCTEGGEAAKRVRDAREVGDNGACS